MKRKNASFRPNSVEVHRLSWEKLYLNNFTESTKKRLDRKLRDRKLNLEAAWEKGEFQEMNLRWIWGNEFEAYDRNEKAVSVWSKDELVKMEIIWRLARTFTGFLSYPQLDLSLVAFDFGLFKRTVLFALLFNNRPLLKNIFNLAIIRFVLSAFQIVFCFLGFLRVKKENERKRTIS